jgi:GntR family transcriptional regulator
MVERDKARLPWLQMYEILRARIDSGELAPGARVPPVRALAREYGVAGETVSKAVARLREEGLVVTIRSWGTFVREERS